MTSNNSTKKKRNFDEMKETSKENDSTSNNSNSIPATKRRKLSDKLNALKLKKSKKVKKPKGSTKKRKQRGLIPGHCQYETKKAIGDALKRYISLEKWTIPAKCFEVEMDCIAFKHLFGEHGDITPKQFDESTDCVVCRLDDDGSANVFGKTKCKGGSMYGTFTIEKMDVVFFPSQQSARIWFAVDGW
eukprot:UN13396